MKEGVTGATAKTPEKILFGACTVHKGLKYTAGTEGKAGSWNFAESIVGATSGGSKMSLVPEITNVEVDGVYVKTKGLQKKTGGTGSAEVNFIELSQEVIKAALLAKETASADGNYVLLEDKADIVEEDYWENIALVGKTLSGDGIIAILDNVLCTSGFEPEPKNKEGTVVKLTFECHGVLGTNTDTLPWHVYYPKKKTA